MISSVNLMTGCNFFYQIISSGRTNGHGGPHVARGPRVGRACISQSATGTTINDDVNNLLVSIV